MRGLLKKALAVLAAAMVLTTVGCSGTRSITIGISPNASPLSFRDPGGKPDGFIAEMAREAGKRMGMEVNFKYVLMSNRAKNFTTQGVDALWGQIVANQKNKQTMLFTKSYLTDRQVMLVESSSKVEKNSDLVGKVVGTVTGSPAKNALLKSWIPSKARYGAPVEYKEFASAFLALDGLKVDAIAVNETYARYRMTEHAEQYRILSGKLADEDYAVAVRRNDSNLRDAFQSALDAMKADGTSASISKKWFGIDMT